MALAQSACRGLRELSLIECDGETEISSEQINGEQEDKGAGIPAIAEASAKGAGHTQISRSPRWALPRFALLLCTGGKGTRASK